MELKMLKFKQLMLILITFQTVTVAAKNSKISDINILRNIFKPQKEMPCIQDYGVKVSDYLNQFENHATLKNTATLCFLIKGSLSVSQSRNEVNLTSLANLPLLQQLWILPDVQNSEVNKDFNTKIRFNKQTSHGTSMMHLKQLHIETALWSVIDGSLNQILRASTKLEVLRIANINNFRTMDDFRGLLSGVKLTSLKALSVSGMLSSGISLTALNISDVLEPLQAQDLEYLDLSRNYLHVIYGSITAMWPKLRIIDLSYNMLLGRGLRDGSLFLDIFILHQKLEILYIYGQNAYIETKQNKYIENNYIVNDDINRINRRKRSIHKISSYSPPGLQDMLPTLCMTKYNTTINDLISGEKSKFCDIIYCVTKGTRHLANLKYFPCKVFPSFEYILSNLDYSGNCLYNFKLRLSPRLREIYGGYYGERGYVVFENNSVNICLHENQVKTLSLPSISDSTGVMLLDSVIMKYYSFSNSVLEDLDLSDNQLHSPLINPFLTSCRYLTTLNIAKNFITFTGNETLHNYFPFIKKLDISYNNISAEDIPVDLLTNAVKIQDLNLAGNKLKKFSLNLKSAGNLTNLNISGNEITAFELKTINDFKNFRQDNTVIRIDLRNNQLNCGCSLEEISTIDLIKNAEKYHIEFIARNLYTCNDKNTTRLILDIDIPQYELNCNYPHLTLILSIILSNVALLTSILSSMMCYKYRYKLLTRFLRLRWIFQESVDTNENYIYNAFVSFASDDRYWVHNTLVSKLEGKYGFKLCIHYRDFMGGNSIHDEIAKKMKSSKVIIVVLSSNSLKSGWCDHELTIAQTHHIETGKKLLIIKLGNIDDQGEHVTPFIKSILQSKVYVTWPEERGDGMNQQQAERGERMNHVVEDKKMLFWVQMANSLYDRDVSCCLFCRKIGPRILESVASQETSQQESNATSASGDSDDTNMNVIHLSNNHDSDLLLA